MNTTNTLMTRMIEMQEEILDLAVREINDTLPPMRPEDVERVFRELEAAIAAAVSGDAEQFSEMVHNTNPDLCRALGHRTLENVLRDGI